MAPQFILLGLRCKLDLQASRHEFLRVIALVGADRDLT
jgi:hypothetical protein